MREIKFRAWNKHNKYMCMRNECNPRINWLAETDPTIFEIMADEFILMQFTGLHDKNGKEIYEGDIVKRWMGRDINGDIWKYMEIKLRYDDGHMRWLSHYNKTDFGKEIQVIGNIYENSDLIYLLDK